MKGALQWSQEKSAELKERRGVSFEDVVANIESGHLLDVLPHWNPEEYPGQSILVVEIEDYAFAVPAERRGSVWRLVTAYPSRKLTRHYLGIRS